MNGYTIDWKGTDMSEYIMAEQNDRIIPEEDVIFGISSRANKMIKERGAENVVNATIGMLLDDDGKLMVMSAVAATYRTLEPTDYAQYAPIGGTPGYKKAVKRAVFKNYTPQRDVRVVATPGGTGSLRCAVANYSKREDSILTSDWHWSPYNSIASEGGRKVATFNLFNEEGAFDIKSFRESVEALLETQDSLLIILNTPAHNPTGYALTDDDWHGIRKALYQVPDDKRVTVLVDIAYIDFAGDEDAYRSFLPLLETFPDNVLPILGFSASKTFTGYGMRAGAMVCLAPTEQIADEFVRVCEFSCRATWSNSPKAGQVVIEKIFSDEALLAEVTREREVIRNLLIRRGKAFEEAAYDAGLDILPFDAGFFATIPCDNAKEVSMKLEQEGIFLVPLAKGLRVSIASISEEKCRMLPEHIVAAMND